jgi:hypothetical protein
MPICCIIAICMAGWATPIMPCIIAMRMGTCCAIAIFCAYFRSR